jgi:hypothetical protein
MGKPKNRTVPNVTTLSLERWRNIAKLNNITQYPHKLTLPEKQGVFEHTL